ncbi:MAG: NAD-dependent epimerase/dehydratase family protein [Solirubrobacterales bacterium]
MSGSDRHVLVVGGAGYVGNVLVRRLLAAGNRVRVLDRLIFEHGAALAPLLEEEAFSFHHGDTRSAEDLDAALDGVSDVVLLAGLVGDPVCKRYPELAREINVDGCRGVFDALEGRGIGRFVFASTCSNYGLRESDEPATEESELAPVSLYAEHKVEVERHILARAGELDFCPTVLRVATAYGLSPRMRFDLTISEFTHTLASGRELIVYDADTWRPYCHVQDISSAVETVFESPADDVRAEVFNVGHSDENYTKRMVVEAALERLGGEGRVKYTEGGSDPRNYRVSFEKIAAQLGFTPAFRVPMAIASLVEAVRAGAFIDLDDRQGFYTNHEVSERALGAHLAEAGAD